MTNWRKPGFYGSDRVAVVLMVAIAASATPSLCGDEHGPNEHGALIDRGRRELTVRIDRPQ
jgi:hypothetical protein